MQKKLSIFVLFTTFFLCWPVYGIEQYATSKTPPERIQSSNQIQQQSQNEIIILKEQNKLIRDYQTSILSTVYWALGGVFTILAFLAGFGWWSNFKMYEADKVRLQQDLISKINELDSKLALRLEENRAELERVVDAKGEAQLARLSSELTDVRMNIANLTGESHKRFEEINAVREALDDEIKTVEKSILGAESDLRFVEEFVWDTRENPDNILITQCQGIEACLEGGHAVRINGILRRMRDTLQKYYINKHELLSKSQYSEVIELLGKLSGKNKIPANETLALLMKVKVRADL